MDVVQAMQLQSLNVDVEKMALMVQHDRNRRDELEDNLQVSHQPCT